MKWVIVLLLFASTTQAQQIIEGRVVDAETKKPVSFASIVVLGTTKGTSSNLEGQFTLSVSGVASLKITSIGYESIVVRTNTNLQSIELKPTAIQLNEVVVFNKKVNPRKIVRMAFANIHANYEDHPFLEKFFYRHYCKDNSSYGRLIEAFVDVWKDQGYHMQNNEEVVRVTQLRRSLDKTTLAQGHEPISLHSILHADLVAHQLQTKSEHLSFYADVSDLKTDFSDYTFTFEGATSYDGQEVYKINYVYKKDSALLTSGKYQMLTQVDGTLFITIENPAFVKTEETKRLGQSSVRTSAYYRKFNDRYYPYHLSREGQNILADNSSHFFRIDLTSVEIDNDASKQFAGREPTREELLNIHYDSVFWNNNSILKTTPLEDEIIRDLGGGISLDKQFDLYRQYELNTSDGGTNGEEKFNWLRSFNKGRQPLYVFFWSSDCALYLKELEAAKALQKKHRNKITFVFLALDDDEKAWKEAISRFALFSEGVVNYRMGEDSELAKSLGVNSTPAFGLFLKTGEYLVAKPPSNLTDEEIQNLLK